MISSSILVFIAFFDFKYRRIPNVLVLALVIIELIEGSAHSSCAFIFISVIGLFLFAYLSRCGMGDIKLLLVIINLCVGSAWIVEYLGFLIAISTISIVAHLLRYRVITGDFAFAPAICGAVLALRVVSPA